MCAKASDSGHLPAPLASRRGSSASAGAVGDLSHGVEARGAPGASPPLVNTAIFFINIFLNQFFKQIRLRIEFPLLPIFKMILPDFAFMEFIDFLVEFLFYHRHRGLVRLCVFFLLVSLICSYYYLSLFII